MKPKMPIASIDMTNYDETVENFLTKNRKYAYTIYGILVECFNVKKADIEGKLFKDMPKEIPSLYQKVKKALLLLQQQGKVKKGKCTENYRPNFWHIIQ